jgi:hypothetical protein
MEPFLPQTLEGYANVATAVATSLAVAISLYLSSRKEWPQIKVLCSKQVLVGHSQASELLAFTITNQGILPVTIKSILWERRIFLEKPRYAIQNVESQILQNPTLPHKLENHGDQAIFSLSLSTWRETLKKTESSVFKARKRKDLDSLYVVIITSTGQTYRSRPHGDILDQIWQAISDNKKAHS